MKKVLSHSDINSIIHSNIPIVIGICSSTGYWRLRFRNERWYWVHSDAQAGGSIFECSHIYTAVELFIDEDSKVYSFDSEEELTTFLENEKVVTLTPSKGIVLTAKKEIHQGNRVYNIKKLQAIKRESLPSEYINSTVEPVVFLDEEGVLHMCNTSGCPSWAFGPGDHLPPKQWIELVQHCHKAGEHLKGVNQKIKAATANWRGNVNMVI